MLDIDKINKTPFFFIVARGRSGTTMLQNILDANEHILIPTESRLIIFLKQKYFNVKDWDSNRINDFIEDLYRDKKFLRYWEVDKSILTKNINSIPKEKISFKLLCKIIYLSYPSPYRKENILLIGDKNPIYCMFIKDIIEIFPEAKFIHLVRDYRANILSDLKTFGYEILTVVCHGWVYYNKNIEKEKEKYPKQFLTIRYEDLVSDPSQNVIKICDFLRITFDEKMLSFNKVIKNKVLTEVSPSIQNEINTIHPNLSKPINTDNIEKWKKELSKNQIETIEYIAAEYGKKHNYLPSLPATKKVSIIIKARSGALRSKLNFLIIKSYYKLPMFLRILMSNSSAFLYEKFNYKNYFNSADFRHKENPKE